MNKILRSEEWWIALITAIILPIINATGVKLNINDVLAIIIPIVIYIFGVSAIKFKSKFGSHGVPFYKSRKWWLTTTNTVVLIFNRILNINIDPNLLYPMILVAASYIIGESIADITNLPKESNDNGEEEIIPDNPE